MPESYRYLSIILVFPILYSLATFNLNTIREMSLLALRTFSLVVFLVPIPPMWQTRQPRAHSRRTSGIWHDQPTNRPEGALCRCILVKRCPPCTRCCCIPVLWKPWRASDPTQLCRLGAEVGEIFFFGTILQNDAVSLCFLGSGRVEPGRKLR